jgi:NAD-dependent deacetylase
VIATTDAGGALRRVAERLRGARRVTVLTGAGVSAASGVPTFRGPSGLWKSFRPEELATPEAFARDPRLVWEWYDWRRTLIDRCQPNAAHEVLARWSQRDDFTLITQNVDGLHERAGTLGVIRFHGSIWTLRCTASCGPEWDDRTAPLAVLPPRCPRCEAVARPGVVWFGEAIGTDVIERCNRAIDCDIILSIGTSSVVYPAAGLLQAATSRGAYGVEINPVPTGIAGELDEAIAGPAETVLPRLDALLNTVV